ncbi:dCTP deaminase/dUTPase family protein [Konateibacter massiliensis]|uniref:dUTP pyrophosphatase n=1 Tax=Konateibacter massiliensis TaxID=2002841 RepID=UPI000C14B05A|nr:dUTP pyrophosphatase [Konateibacter massiliensis]
MQLNENDLIFSKVKPDAIIPTKKDEDAGYDIFACFEEDYMVIPPHSTVMIPTGIASAMHPSKYIQIEERGSTGSKGIKKSAGVIDSSYRGEWFIPISNVNNVNIIISKLSDYELLNKDIIYSYSKAIAQGIVHEVIKMNKKEIPYEKLLAIKSERGTNCLGSTN